MKVRSWVGRLFNALANISPGLRRSHVGTIAMAAEPGTAVVVAKQASGRRSRYDDLAAAAGARPGDTVVVDPDGSARVVGRRPELSVDNTKGSIEPMTTDAINLPETNSELVAVLSPMGFAKPSIPNEINMTPSCLRNARAADWAAVGQALALQAIREIGLDEFTVVAQLDASRPETLSNFKTFGDVLLRAYQQGIAKGQGHATDLDAETEECHEHESARQATEAEIHAPDGVNDRNAASALLPLLHLQGEFRVQLIAAGLSEAAALDASCTIMDSFMASAAAAPQLKQAYLESLR